jgi:multiple sugar transport system substrate-binding protein
MSIGSTGGTGYNIPGNNEFEVGVAPIPQFDLNNKAVIQQGPNINLFRKSNVQENIAAWLFLKYITAAEQTARWSVATGYSPVRTSAYDVQVYKDYVGQANPSARTQVFIDVANVGKVQSSYMFTSVVFPNSSKVRDEVGNIFTVVFGNTKSVDDAFDDAYDEARY